jgi:flagellar motor switch protein FliG
MAEPAVDGVESEGLPPEFEFAFQQLTATEKAAIVMFLLEEAGAAAVMQTLSPTQVTSVSRAMIKVSDIPQPIVVAVEEHHLL